MPIAQVNGVAIHYEVAGSGFPLVLAHEWGGSAISWTPQIRRLGRFYKVITYDARGYVPSAVPESLEAYSQETAVADLHGLLVHLGISEAYIAGLSMGGGTSASFAISHPDMTRALILASTGAGATNRAQWESDLHGMMHDLETAGVSSILEAFSTGPTRIQLRRKDPTAWQEFHDDFAKHSALGLARCMQGVVMARKTILQMEAELREIKTPTFIMVGDEDEPCIEPGLFMKRTIANSGLSIFPHCGHLLNLEEPELFNAAMLDFLIRVEKGAWPAL